MVFFLVVLQNLRDQHAALREANWIEQELVKRLSYGSKLPVSTSIKRRLLETAAHRYRRLERDAECKFLN